MKKVLERPSFYKVTYLGGSTETICAKTPKDAYKIGAQKALLMGLEVVFVKFLR